MALIAGEQNLVCAWEKKLPTEYLLFSDILCRLVHHEKYPFCLSEVQFIKSLYFFYCILRGMIL